MYDLVDLRAQGVDSGKDKNLDPDDSGGGGGGGLYLWSTHRSIQLYGVTMGSSHIAPVELSTGVRN